MLNPIALRAGKAKAFAVASEKRSPALPQVPTFAEVGVPDFTPAEEVDSLVTCTRTHFIVTARVEGYESDRQVFSREFSERIRRKGN